ncbi:1-phosphatidylinositol-3-phosphate 5-kinase FAB1B [Hibiscus syriacus]|uniref:1-phosphatidylinositol-3-phosphate 5-kinase FAB1B n=1 Tax=Hibiscus syriacus TaxID=106335 RepID=A0A6A2XM14_HIBSY|nr:1-phosphatidylinositol-3-phosphate 5-kinase FAB1B [Hibiscus syriacus]
MSRDTSYRRKSVTTLSVCLRDKNLSAGCFILEGVDHDCLMLTFLIGNSRSIISTRSAMKKSMRRPSLKTPRFSKNIIMDSGDPSSNQYELSWNSIGIDDEDMSDFSEDNGYYMPLSFDDMSNNDGSTMSTAYICLIPRHCITLMTTMATILLSALMTLAMMMSHKKFIPVEKIYSKSLSSSLVNRVPSPSSEAISQLVKKDERDGDECKASPSLYPAEPETRGIGTRQAASEVGNLALGNNRLRGKRNKDSWLEIITALSWEAASLLKPYTTKGGEMDLGGYVKVKCIASGHCKESPKPHCFPRPKHSKICYLPSILLVSHAASRMKEMDHLKMAVAKIFAHKPNILLVEKTVSRFAYEYLLEKNISLALNIKRPLLERIARCTGAQIISSIDHLFSQKLGYCEKFHVERFREDLGSAGQGRKKLVKTLMYFEGCPKPLGCTTSFLADEGASLPEFPNSPMVVAFPDSPSTIARSISTVPNFTVPANMKSPVPQHFSGPQRATSVPSEIISRNIQNIDETPASCLSKGTSLWSVQPILKESSAIVSFTSEKTSGVFSKKSEMGTKESSMREIVVDKNKSSFMNNVVRPTESLAHMNSEDNSTTVELQPGCSEATSVQQNGKNHNNHSEVSKPLKEVFPSAPSDNQSILVSLSSRCVRKGTFCERSHLFCIKYYGSFDKPLGRFLCNHLFDRRCPSCELPSEAHVHCYTHRRGTLTMSVKKLPETLLPGEKEGKIWMWHRCLQCPRTNGFPPATRRRVMSDAAWGLSFGKFS